MATTLGSLILELGLDDTKFTKQLADIQKLASRAGKDIEGNIKGITSKTKLETLKPTVDHEPLAKLNKHIERKREHLKEVNKYFGDNPLTPKTNVEELSNFKNQFDGITDKKVKITTETSSSEISYEDSYLPSRSLLRLDNSLQELHLQNKGLTIANENLANSISALSMSVKQNIKSQDDMPMKMSKIIHTSSKETLVDKIVGLPARAFETFITGAVEGMGQTLSYDFAKGAQKYIEGKTGSDAETVGYNFGRYGYNRTKGLAMVTAEAFGYRGGLKEVGDDIAYLGRKLDSFLDPRKLVRNIKTFEDLLVGVGEDVRVYNDPKRAKSRIDEYIRPPWEEVAEGGRRVAGVGVRAIAQPYRIQKRVMLAQSMELSKQLAEVIDVPDIEGINDKETIALIAGGIPGNDYERPGDNTYFANVLLKELLGEQVATVPVPNKFSNDKQSGQTIRQFKSILLDLLRSLGQVTPGSDLEKQLMSDEASQFEKLISMAVDAGYNPDAIKLEATRRAYEKKYPGKKFVFAGTSGGTFAAEEATAIAERGGAKNTKGVGLTMGTYGLTNTASLQNFKAFVGDMDPIFLASFGERYSDMSKLSEQHQKMLEKEMKKMETDYGLPEGTIKNLSGIMRPGKATTIIPGAGAGHSLGQFIQNPKVQEEVAKFLRLEKTESQITLENIKTFAKTADAEFLINLSDRYSDKSQIEEQQKIKKESKDLGLDETEIKARIDEYKDTITKELASIEEVFVLPTGTIKAIANKLNSDILREIYDGGTKPNEVRQRIVSPEVIDPILAKQATQRSISNVRAYNLMYSGPGEQVGLQESMRRTLGVLIGDPTAVEEQKAGKYTFVTPEGRLRKTYGDSQEKSDIEYNYDELKADLRKSMKNLTGQAKQDVEAFLSIYDTLIQSLKNGNEIDPDNLIDMVEKFYSVFGVAPDFPEKSPIFKPEQMEYLAQLNKQHKRGTAVSGYLNPAEAQVLGEGVNGIIFTDQAREKGFKMNKIGAPEWVDYEQFKDAPYPLNLLTKKMMQPEAEALRAVGPELAPQVYDVGNNRLVQEVLKGKDMGSMVKELEKSGELTQGVIIQYVEGAAKLLKSLHEKKVTHGDYHAGNIFVMEDGSMKTIDLGAAKVNASKEQIKADAERAPERIEEAFMRILAKVPEGTEKTMELLLKLVKEGKMPLLEGINIQDIFNKAYKEGVGPPTGMRGPTPRDPDAPKTKWQTKKYTQPATEPWMERLSGMNKTLEDMGKPSAKIDPNMAYILGQGAKGIAFINANKDAVYKLAKNAVSMASEAQAMEIAKGVAPDVLASGDDFIIQRAIAGQEGRDYLANKDMTKDDVSAYAKQAGASLRALHEKGVTHGDYHPGNVFVSDEGKVVPIDYGRSIIKPDKMPEFEKLSAKEQEKALEEWAKAIEEDRKEGIRKAWEGIRRVIAKELGRFELIEGLDLESLVAQGYEEGGELGGLRTFDRAPDPTKISSTLVDFINNQVQPNLRLDPETSQRVAERNQRKTRQSQATLGTQSYVANLISPPPTPLPDLREVRSSVTVSTEEAVAIGSEMAISFLQGVGEGLTNIAESTGEAMAIAAETRLVAAVNRIMRRVPGDPDSLDANAPIIEKISDIGPEQIARASALGIEDGAAAIAELAQKSISAATALAQLTKSAGKLLSGAQPAANEFIEGSRKKLSAAKDMITSIQTALVSSEPDESIIQKIKLLAGDDTGNDQGYVNRLLTEVNEAIVAISPQDRMKPLAPNQLANLKSQIVKIENKLRELASFLNDIRSQDADIIDAEIIQDFSNFAELPSLSQQQVRQLTAAQPPPDYQKMVKKISEDFADLRRIVENKKNRYSREEQKIAAAEIIKTADEAWKAIDDLQKVLGDRATTPFTNLARAAKGQATQAKNRANEKINTREIERPDLTRSLGQETIDGYPVGFSDRFNALKAEATRLVETGIIDPMAKGLQTRSPSKVTEYFGKMVVAGLIKGIKSNSDAVKKVLNISSILKELAEDLYLMADMYQGNLRKAFDMSVIKDELTILRDSINEALTLAGQLENTSEAVQSARTAVGRIVNYPNETIVTKYKEDVRSNARRVLTEPPDSDIHPVVHEIPADAKKIIFVSSGFTGTKGRISNEITDKLKPMIPQGTHTIPFENKNFDVSGTLNDVGLTRVVMDAIIMPMKAVRKGINEEALRLAKQAYAVKQERPDVEIGFVGHSAGGFIVREAQEILKNIGIISEALSMGTPLLGAFQAIKSDVISLIGEGDPLKRFTGQKEAIIPNVKGHFSPHYLDESNEIREILTRYLEEGITPSLIARVHELGETIKGLEPGNSGPVMRFDRLRQSQSYQQAYLLKTHTNTIDVKAEEVKNNKIQPLWSVDRNTKDSFDEDMSNEVTRNIGEIIDTLDDITPKARKVFEELVTEIAALSDVEVKEMPTAKNASMQLLGTRAGGAYLPEYNTIFLDDETEEALESLHDIKGLDIPISLKVIEDEVREVYKRLNNNTSDDIYNDYNDELDLAYETVNKKYSNITEDIISLFEAMDTIVHEIRHAAQVGFQKINDPYSRNLLLTPSYNRESDREYARNIAGSVELAKKSAKEQGIDINPHYINKLERDAYGFSHQYTRDIIRSYQRYNNTKTENILPASKNIGSELGSGIAIGINNSSREATNAAMNMAEAVIDITHSTFDIKSPPEWAIKIGRFISEGISNGISDGINYVRESIKSLKTKTVNDIKEWAKTPPEESFMPFSVSGERPEAEIPVIGPAYAFMLDSMESMKNMATFVPKLGRSLGEVFEGLSQNIPAMMSITKGFLFFNYIVVPLVGTLFSFEEAAFQTAVELENMATTINFVSGSASEGAKNIDLIRNKVISLGGDLKSSMQGFAQLGASAQGTRLEGEGTRQIFSAISQAAVVYQMTPEEQQQAFTALSQMMDKTVVSAEELRGQLAEALPGSISVAARAMGVTTQELGKMMQAGEVMAEDLLPKFAQQLSAETAMGVSGSARSAQTAINKLNNEITLFQQGYGNTTIPIRVVGLNIATKGIQILRENVVALSVVFTALLVTISATLVQELAKFFVKFAGMNQTIALIGESFSGLFTRMKQELITFGKSFLTWFAVITVATDVFKIFSKGFGDASGGAKDLADSNKKAWEDYTKTLEDARQKTKEFNEQPSFKVFKESGGVTAIKELFTGGGLGGYVGDIIESVSNIDGSRESYGNVLKSVTGIKQIVDISNSAKKFFEAFKDGIGISSGLERLISGESLLEDTFFGGLIGDKASRIFERGTQSFIGNITDGNDIRDYTDPIGLALGGLKNIGLDLSRTWEDVKAEQADIAINDLQSYSGKIYEEARTTLYPGNKPGQQLQEIIDLDVRLQSAQQELQGTSREDVEKQRDLNEQINNLIAEREKLYIPVGKQLANLQLSEENIKSAIKLRKEELARLGDSEEDNIRRESLQGNIATLESDLKLTKSLIDKINSGIANTVTRLDLLARGFRLVNAEMENAYYNLEMRSAQKNALLMRSVAPGNSGLLEGTQNLVQQQMTSEKIAINRDSLQKLETIAYDPEYIKALENANLAMNATAADIQAAIDNIGEDSSLSKTLTNLVEVRQKFEQTGLETDQLVAELETTKRQLEEQLWQMGRQLEDMLIEVGQQTEEIAHSFKEFENDRKVANASNTITRTMGKLRTDHFSGMMNILERFINVIGEQLKSTSDFLKQKMDVMNQLFNTLRQNEQFALSIPQIDQGVIGSQGTNGRNVASPLMGQSIESLVSYKPTEGQSFRAGRTRNGRQEYHAGIDWDSKVGGGRGADVAAPFSGTARVIDIAEQKGDRGNAVQVRITTQDAKGIPIDLQFNHLELESVKKALGIGIGENTNVSMGQLVGEVIQHHLDMKVKVNGQFVDAQQWLAAMNAGGGVARNLQGVNVNINPISQPASRTAQSTPQQSGVEMFRNYAPVASRVASMGPGRIPMGGTVRTAERVQSDPAGAQAMIAAAQRLGLDPREFAALMSWESAGSFNPNIRGGDNNLYKGLIQFSPDNQRKYGTNTQQSIAQQMPAIERYLLDRGFRPGEHDIRHAYSAILAGQAGESYWNRKDSNQTTVRNAAPRFRQGDHRQRAEQFLRDSGIGMNELMSEKEQFERFMREGYALTEKKDYQSALINFRRAEELRPDNKYTTQAISNVTGYINRSRPTTTSSSATTLDVSSYTQSSNQLLSENQKYVNMLQQNANDQIKLIEQMKALADERFDAQIDSMFSEVNREGITAKRGTEDAKLQQERQDRDRKYQSIPEFRMTPEIQLEYDLDMASRDIEDRRIELQRQIEDAQNDIDAVTQLLETMPNQLIEAGAKEEDVRRIEEGFREIISQKQPLIDILRKNLADLTAMEGEALLKISEEYKMEEERRYMEFINQLTELTGENLRQQAELLRNDGEQALAEELEKQADAADIIQKEKEYQFGLKEQLNSGLDRDRYDQLLAESIKRQILALEILGYNIDRNTEQLRLNNSSFLLEQRAANVEALTPLLNRTGEAGNARDLSYEIEALKIQQDLESQIFDLYEGSKGLTEETRERSRLLIEETAQLKLQTLELEQALQVRADQIEQSRNPLVGPGGVTDLMGAQDAYLGAFGASPTEAMKQERLPFLLDMQRLDYQNAILELEKLKNAGKLTDEGFKAMSESLSKINDIKMDQIRQEASMLPDVIKNVRGPVQGLFSDLMKGTKTVGEAFNDFVNGLIDNLMNLAAEMLTNNLFAGIFGGAAGISSDTGNGIIEMLFGTSRSRSPEEDPNVLMQTPRYNPLLQGAMDYSSYLFPSTGEIRDPSLTEYGKSLFGASTEDVTLTTGAEQASASLRLGGEMVLSSLQLGAQAIQQAAVSIQTPNALGTISEGLFDLGGFDLTFENGAQSIQSAIEAGADRGGAQLGSVVMGVFSGSSSTAVSKGGFSIGGVFQSLLSTILGMFFKDGGVIKTDTGLGIENFAKGGVIGRSQSTLDKLASTEAIGQALKREGNPKARLAVVSPGEWVLNRQQQAIAKRYGVDENVLNFKNGGVVGGSFSTPAIKAPSGGSTSVTVPITINSDGNNPEKDNKAARDLSQKVRAAVFQVLTEQKRPNGLLY
jgi:tape measure domain-containing protein